mmetsp:Transcript_10039/g.18197  ORF Transcript_10039/g.18197 Transcript_10039/m.18197 type:complete len:144 (+) Transcript_10039:41-472(+)
MKSIALLLVILSILCQARAGDEASVETPSADDDKQSPSPIIYNICESTNEELVGAYSHTHFVDDAPVWTNEEGMGIWRHFGYWYIGDYGEWPPVTFYRCVVGCEQGREEPPLEGFKNKKGYEGGPVKLQLEPCGEGEGTGEEL